MSPLIHRVLGSLLALIAAVAAVAVGSAPVGARDARLVATGPSGTTYSLYYSCIDAAAGYTWDRTNIVDGYAVQFEVLSENGFDAQFGGSRPLTIGTVARATRTLSLQKDPRQGYVHENVKMYEVSPSGNKTLLLDHDVDCPDYSSFDRSYFTAVAPERVLDTRPNKKINSNGVKPSAGATVTIPRSALPGIPDGAVAVSMTVTGTASGGRGFVQAFPTGEAETGSSSTLNFTGPNQTVANASFVPLAADGSVSLFTNVTAHLIVDVNGYFVDAAAEGTGGRFQSIDPLRIYDTRAGKQINHSGPAVPPDQVARIDLTADDSGLPPGALAAVVNITATRSPSAGFVQAGPGGTLVKGDSSVLNIYDPTETIAGMAVVPLAADGSIDLLTNNGADIVVDLLGWFTATGDDSDVGLFVPLPPQRIYDTRFATFLNGIGIREGAIDVDLGYTPSTAGSVGLAGLFYDGGASAVMTNLTVTRALGPGFFEVRDLIRLGEGGQTSSLNLPAAGATKANAVIADVYQGGGFSIYANAGGQVIVDVTGFFT